MQSKKRYLPQFCSTGWCLLGAILLLACFSVLPSSAQSQATVIRSDPAVLEINPGQVATLTIVLAEAQDVYGIDVSASFDPQLVEVVDADPAKDGIQLTVGAFPQPDFVARNIADNQAGTLRYAVTQVNPTEPASGSGAVVSMQFRAKAANGQSALTIGPVELADRTGTLLDVQAESGMIRIVPAGQATTATTAPAGDTQPTQDPLPPVTVAPASESDQTATSTASTPEAPAAAESSLPLIPILVVLALIVVVVAVVIARRRAER